MAQKQTLPPQTDQALWNALFVANYHLALHDPMNSDWASHARRRPFQPPMDLLTAIATVSSSKSKDLHHTHLRNHTNAVLAQIHNMTHKTGSPIDGLRSYLQNVGLDVNGVEEASSRLGEALVLAYSQASNIPDLKFEWIEQRSGILDPSGVTRFYAAISRARTAAETFDQIATQSDPRNWENVFKGMFTSSRNIGDRVCEGRYDDPTRVKHPPPDVPPFGQTWNGNLFEQWTWLDTIVFRNLLSVDVVRTKHKMTFNYHLFESLSNAELEEQRGGGIDVDSNDKDSCEVALNGDTLRIKAGKNIRFSTDAGPFQYSLNLMALPFLCTWITGLLFKAVSFSVQPLGSRPSSL